ncbi:MAG: winged helix-turn-helix domain-containing protein [Thermoplasmatota archaeon]
MEREYAYLHFPADAVQVDRRLFGRLPPSAQKVFEAVRDQGPLTNQELQEATAMPARTVRYAVKRLKEEGLVDTRCSLRDCRTCYFFVDKRCVGVEALEQARREAERDAASQGRTIEKV